MINLGNQNIIRIDEIFNILKKEVQHYGGPQELPFNFYQNIAGMISMLQDNSLDVKYEKNKDEHKNNSHNDDDGDDDLIKYEDKVQKQIKNKMLELVIKLIALLFINRIKKILDAEKIHQTWDYSNLTDEEKYVFHGSRERQQRIDIILNMMLNGKPKTLEKIVSSINQHYIIIRFLDSMEQFVGVNMNKYGPFQYDDIAILPFENARSIIESKKAVEVKMIN